MELLRDFLCSRTQDAWPQASLQILRPIKSTAPLWPGKCWQPGPSKKRWLVCGQLQVLAFLSESTHRTSPSSPWPPRQIRATCSRLPSLQEGRGPHSGKAGGGKGSSIPSAFSPASKDPKDPNFQKPSRGSAVAVADPDSLLMAVCFLLLVKASWAWLPPVQPPSLSPANFDFTASTTTLLWMAPQIFPPADNPLSLDALWTPLPEDPLTSSSACLKQTSFPLSPTSPSLLGSTSIKGTTTSQLPGLQPCLTFSRSSLCTQLRINCSSLRIKYNPRLLTFFSSSFIEIRLTYSTV